MSFYMDIDINLISSTAKAKLSSKDNRLLTIVFGGFGYNLDMPIFYYTLKFLDTKKTDVLQINLGYDQDKKFLRLSEDEQDEIFIKDLEHIDKFLESLDYDNFLFIGKSLGTTSCYTLLKDKTLYDKTLGCVWITPGTYASDINNFILESDIKSLIIYGTNDEYSKMLDLEKLNKEEHIKLFEVSKANHSLECDTLTDSIINLEKIIKEISTFISSII